MITLNTLMNMFVEKDIEYLSRKIIEFNNNLNVIIDVILMDNVADNHRNENDEPNPKRVKLDWYRQQAENQPREFIDLTNLSGPVPSTSGIGRNEKIKSIQNTLELCLPTVDQNWITARAQELVDKPHGFVDTFVSKSLDALSDLPKRTSLNDPVPSTSGVNRNEKRKSIQETLELCLPTVEQNWITARAQELVDKPSGFVDTFVSASLDEISKLPKRKSYVKKKEVTNEPITIENLLNKYAGDPESHFLQNTKVFHLTSNYRDKAYTKLTECFRKHSVRTIARVLYKNANHFLPAYRELKQIPSDLCGPRARKYVDYYVDSDPDFIEELFYVENEDAIKEHLQKEENRKKEMIESGGFFECQCCYDDQVILFDVIECELGHMFCSNCVKRGVETQIGQNNNQVTCFTDCNGKFPISAMKKVLDPNMFKKYCQRTTVEELQAAGVDNIEFCPKCGWPNNIVNPDDKIFKCANEECLKETCRLCHEDAHIPLRCDEIEKDAEVQARIKKEEALTNAMKRECYNCGTAFLKTIGCKFCYPLSLTSSLTQ